MKENSRRRMLAAIGLASGAALLDLSGCSRDVKKVGAVEDLMREHGVIRRVILVYRNCAAKLRAGAGFDLQALQAAAQLMRTFGEEYHEKKLEEAYIFPALKHTTATAAVPGAAYVDTLLAQHQRGREITAYVLGIVGKGSLGSGDAGPLADALDGFELMYEHHAAREDTVVFQAWKATMSGDDLADMGEKFEHIEQQQFGKDGFEMAAQQIADIEQKLGLTDISQFTPKRPKT